MPIDSSLYLALKQKTIVDLSYQGLDNDDLVKIAYIIIENPDLRELNLSNNKITDITEAVLDLFVSHPSLYEIKVQEELAKYVGTKNSEQKKNTKEVRIDKSLPPSKILALRELMGDKQKLLTLNELLKKLFDELLDR